MAAQTTILRDSILSNCGYLFLGKYPSILTINDKHEGPRILVVARNGGLLLEHAGGDWTALLKRTEDMITPYLHEIRTIKPSGALPNLDDGRDKQSSVDLDGENSRDQTMTVVLDLIKKQGKQIDGLEKLVRKQMKMIRKLDENNEGEDTEASDE